MLDEEIELKQAYLDAPDVEEDSYYASLCFLLLNMSSLYIERRHYSEAIRCLNEAESYSKDKLPDVFFRRSQARTYNKYSTINDLQLALEDLEKAFISLEEYNLRNKDNYLSKNNNLQIYKEHKEILLKMIEKKKTLHKDKIECLLNHSKESLKLCQEKKRDPKECFFAKPEEQIRQYKILKE